MKEKPIALYHRIMRRENFEVAAKDLFQLLVVAQKKEPNRLRVLYVDIDGHRNEENGFDKDMFELQKEFGLKFLLPYFTEIHFPLISVKNPKEQRNDIPDNLQIINADNEKDSSLRELYIENYSNTEFMSEKEIYTYLQKVSEFLKRYYDMAGDYVQADNEDYDSNGWLIMWYVYMRDLINELFNLFLGGNLLSATAMTRTLIECYAYLRIFKKEKSARLLNDWYLCSIFDGMRGIGETEKRKIYALIQPLCQEQDMDYTEVVKRFSKGNENEWLTSVIPAKRVNFHSICNYLGEPDLYHDFQYICSFVHGQSIISKMNPFTFYSSIYQKLYLMMSYIFKTIRLYPMKKEMEEEIQVLEEELFKLAELYNV